MNDSLYADNPQLALASQYLTHTGVSIFLTGRAGTGKTTFLKQLQQESLKRMVVTAPTGVAAINAGGVTLHSFFQLAFAPYLPQLLQKGMSLEQKMQNFRFNKTKLKIIRSMELLVIDEISMVRADVLDAVSDILCRYRHSRQPFGGLQVLFIGDVQQLAPVAKDDEWEVLKQVYQTPYFFSSQAFAQLNYRTIELEHIYRQKDRTFISLLNQIRTNQIDSTCIDKLNSRYCEGIVRKKEDGAVILTTHRYQAEQINKLRMSELQGKSSFFEAKVEGSFPKSAYPNDFQLELKSGAQVLFVKNDSEPQKRYYNGKMGVVVDIEEDIIRVKCEGEEDPIEVGVEIWTNMRYALDKATQAIVEVEDGRFIQYPLRAAWAITIHKSQGLTFDRLIVDAAEAFAHGQVYVALSRCRSLEGLSLSSRLSFNSFFSDTHVAHFSEDANLHSASEELLATDRREYYYQLLVQLFDYEPLYKSLWRVAEYCRDHFQELDASLWEQWQAYLKPLQKELMDVSRRFHLQLRQLVYSQEDYEHSALLEERIQKGLAYMSATLGADAARLLEASRVETDNKEQQKEIQELCQNAQDLLHLCACCHKAIIRDGFSISNYLKAKADAVIQGPNQKTAPKPERDTDMQSALYEALRLWRSDTASIRNVPAYVVLNQKALRQILIDLPQTAEDLLKVKGVGKKTVQLYGDAILERIKEHFV